MTDKSLCLADAVRGVVEELERRVMLSGTISAGQSLMVFNSVIQGASGAGPSPVEPLTISNAGATTLNLSGFTIVNDPASPTQDASLFAITNAGSLPASLVPGQSTTVDVDFTAGTSSGLFASLLQIQSDDPVTPTETISLHGIGTTGLQGANQPSLARILDAYDIPTNVGETVNQDASLYPYPPLPSTQEVAMQRLVAANPGPVTMQILAVFDTAAQPVERFGYYTPGQPAAQTELFSINQSQAQSVYVQAQGATSFDAGTSPFGLYFVSSIKDNGQNRIIYSEDGLNTFDTTTGRHMRFFPLENAANGSTVPNAYVVTVTDYNAPAGYDFTNLVAIIRNVAPAPGAPTGAALSLINKDGWPYPNHLVFSRIQIPNASLGDAVHDTDTLTLQNSGVAPLVITSLALSDSTDWEFVNEPALPLTIQPSASQAITLKFIATTEPARTYDETNGPNNANGGGVYTGTLTIASNDPVNPSTVVNMAGWWQDNSEDNEEPSLQTVINLMGAYQTEIDANIASNLTESTATGATPTYYGEELTSNYEYWSVADPSQPATILQLDAYHTQNGNAVPTSWYPQGSSGSLHQLIDETGNNGQSILPEGASLFADFSPTGSFGFKVDITFSDDSLNATKYPQGGGHQIRFYPLRDRHGNLVPNTYLMCQDYGIDENFDFQDNVFLVTNIRPAALPPTPTDLQAISAVGGAQLQWAPVTYGTLEGYDVYRCSTARGTYTLLNSTPITQTSYTDTGASVGTWYYRITAVDSSTGNQSEVSQANAQSLVPPSAHNDKATTTAGVSVVISPLANDTDSDGTIVSSSIVIVHAASNGAAAIDPSTGTITYTPNPGFVGTDTLTYTCSDSNGATSNVATITITVTGPGAQNDTATTVQGQAVVIDELANDVDNSGAIIPSSVAVATQPTHGTVSVDPTTGDITYTPAATYIGTDSLTYTYTDSNGAVSQPATITITVNKPAAGPFAANQSVNATTAVPLIINILANDTDSQGTLQPSTVTITLAPAHGSVSVDPTTGAITYTSLAAYTGHDSLQYTVADNNGTVSNVATISITVVATPVSPVGSNFAGSTTVSKPVTINILQGAHGTIAITQIPGHGSASVNNSNGTLTYTPVANFVGSDTLSYTITNNGLTSAPATIAVTVGTTIGVGTVQSLFYIDGDGTQTQISLSHGNATVYFSGTGSQSQVGTRLMISGTNMAVVSISAANTTMASALVVRAHGGDGAVQMGGISTTGSLRTINAPAVHLTGGQLYTKGGVGSIILASLEGVEISLGAAAGLGGTALRLGSVDNSDLSTTQFISNLTVQQWTSTDGNGHSITGTGIGTLVSAGDFDPSLTLRGVAPLPTLGSARVGGKIGSGWDIAAASNSGPHVQAGSLVSGWSGQFTGPLASLLIRGGGFSGNLSAGSISQLRITGDMSGTLTADSVGSIIVSGNLSSANIRLNLAYTPGHSALGRLAVGGVIQSSMVTSLANIQAIQAAALLDSTINAGVASGIDQLLTASNLATAASIGSIRLLGPGMTNFVDSNIGANTIGSARLGVIQLANGGNLDGLAAAVMHSVLGTTDGNAQLSLNAAQLKTNATIAAALSAEGINSTDFSIRII